MTGFLAFAGAMTSMAGAFEVVAGLVPLLENEFYDATLLTLFGGFAALAGQTWGRVVGIAWAVLGTRANASAPRARRTDQ